MARGRKSGTGMVALARQLERSQGRIVELRRELQRESEAAQECLAQLQRQVTGISGESTPSRNGVVHAASGRGKGRGGRGGRRGSGQRQAIVAFVKSKGEPQNADAVAAHIGKSKKMGSVRQTLMQMCKAGMLASYKQDDGKYRAPKKGERGGYYGVP